MRKNNAIVLWYVHSAIERRIIFVGQKQGSELISNNLIIVLLMFVVRCLYILYFLVTAMNKLLKF